MISFKFDQTVWCALEYDYNHFPIGQHINRSTKKGDSSSTNLLWMKKKLRWIAHFVVQRCTNVYSVHTFSDGQFHSLYDRRVVRRNQTKKKSQKIWNSKIFDLTRPFDGGIVFCLLLLLLYSHYKCFEEKLFRCIIFIYFAIFVFELF